MNNIIKELYIKYFIPLQAIVHLYECPKIYKKKFNNIENYINIKKY